MPLEAKLLSYYERNFKVEHFVIFRVSNRNQTVFSPGKALQPSKVETLRHVRGDFLGMGRTVWGRSILVARAVS